MSNFNLITEVPGLKASKEQIDRLYHRYKFASEFIAGKDVLEIGCGAGIALGFLAEKSRSVAGVDIDEKNVTIARSLYTNHKSIKISVADAHKLDFIDNSFDLVIFYEAIYYLKKPERFVSEASRVLRENGLLIICTVNKDWQDFHPSPFTHRYFSVPELFLLLQKEFNSVECYGAFHTKSNGIVGQCVSLMKRAATRFHLIPGSLAARAYLKRIFFGPLQPLPDQIREGMTSYEEPIPLSSDKPTEDYKIIYAVARK